MKKMADLGAYIEICAINIFYGQELKRAVEVIEKIGAGRCILSSDAFGEWVPPEPEFLRMLAAYLLISGIKEEDVRTMLCENPAILLGISLPFKKPES
jgi:predicted TIM-barrel fold metal-dependent hydrolase